MKTEKIEEVLSEFRRVLGCIGLYEDAADDSWRDVVSDARAELAALKEENERLRELLKARRLKRKQAENRIVALEAALAKEVTVTSDRP